MGPPLGANSNFRDLTEADRSLALEDCQQRYRRLFENAPLVAYSLDIRQCTLYISPYCHKVFGYSDEEIQEDNLFWHRHIHPEDKQQVHFIREQYLKEGMSFT